MVILIANLVIIDSKGSDLKFKESLYLLEVVRHIVKNNKVKIVEDNSLMNGAITQNHVSDGIEQRLLLFGMSESQIKFFNHENIQPGERLDFHGFYISVDSNSYITDFGWYKP